MKTNLVKMGLLASISFSFACLADHEKAPFGSQVSVPEDVLISWSITNNDVDFRGLIIPFDVGVFRTNQSTGTSEPLPFTEVEITSNYGGVYLIPQEAVGVLDYPSLPPGITSEADVEAACSDEGGNYEMNEEWCAWWWDTRTSQFYQFDGTYADNYEEDTAGNNYFYAPTYMVSETDRSGLVRAYLLIDSMPVLSNQGGEPTIQDVSVNVNIGWDSQAFMITTDAN